MIYYTICFINNKNNSQIRLKYVDNCKLGIYNYLNKIIVLLKILVRRKENEKIIIIQLEGKEAIDILDEVGARKKTSHKTIDKLIDEVIEDTTGVKKISLKKLKLL